MYFSTDIRQKASPFFSFFLEKVRFYFLPSFFSFFWFCPTFFQKHICALGSSAPAGRSVPASYARLCGLTLGAVGIEAQLDQKPVLLGQTFQHLCQADLIRQAPLPGILPGYLFGGRRSRFFRGQAEGGLCGLNRKRDVLHALPQLFCQLRKRRFGPAELPVMLPGRIDTQPKLF